MSQSTMAAARQYEMKTSIAVVTTMICGRGDAAGLAGSGFATRAPLGTRCRDGSRRRSRRARGGACAVLFGAQHLEQRRRVGRVQKPRAASLVVQQPRGGREHLQMRTGAVLGDDQQEEEVRRLAVVGATRDPARA